MYGKISIEIPETCRECRLFVQEFGYICLGVPVCDKSMTQWLELNYAERRPAFCPIIKEELLHVCN